MVKVINRYQYQNRNIKNISKSKSFSFGKYLLIGVISILVLIGIIFLVLYLTKTGPFKNNNNKVSIVPPGPLPTGNIVGAWINAANPPWNIIPNMDIMMLASFTPNPWSSLYPCTSNFSLFPTKDSDNYTNLINLVINGKSKASKVLLSVGGSSFGVGEWSSLLYKYVKDIAPSACQCPTPGYWFGCKADENSCCLQTDKAIGKCGGLYTINNTDNKDCCDFAGNPHKCCCGYGSTLQNVNGVQTCVSSIPNSVCYVPGLSTINQDAYNTCITDAGTDTQKALLCKLTYADPVMAYADCLMATGSDGFDFDYESPDPAGHLAGALVLFSRDLKAEMTRRGKGCILMCTLLSGNSYEAQLGPIYDTLKTNISPFDYAVPMLYSTPQYPYGDPKAQNTWNGLLNYWAQNYMTKGVSNTKLLPAFIENSQGNNFTPDDLEKYICQYIKSSPYTNSMPTNGMLFFWYNNGGDYNTNLLTSNLQIAQNCFSNKKCFIKC